MCHAPPPILPIFLRLCILYILQRQTAVPNFGVIAHLVVSSSFKSTSINDKIENKNKNSETYYVVDTMNGPQEKCPQEHGVHIGGVSTR